MNAKTYLVHTTKAISETMGGETIIINLETGCYYSMNTAGTAIWNALLQGSPIDTDPAGVSVFLGQLVTDGIIQETTSADKPLFVATEIPQLDKYTDMQEMLLADPVHDVDTAGWPNLKKD